jgi:hypothetical protein
MEIKNYSRYRNIYSSCTAVQRNLNKNKLGLFSRNFSTNFTTTPSTISILRGSNLAKTLLLTEMFKGL